MLQINLINYPNKDILLQYVRHEIKTREWADKIKGCIDYEPKDIPGEIYDTIEKLGYKREITRSWIHFMSPGSDHASGHTHSHDTLVIYLQCFPNSGDLLFLDNETYSIIERYSPVEDTMVLVPALQNHSMTVNKSTHDRIAMAFPVVKRE